MFLLERTSILITRFYNTLYLILNSLKKSSSPTLIFVDFVLDRTYGGIGINDF